MTLIYLIFYIFSILCLKQTNQEEFNKFKFINRSPFQNLKIRNFTLFTNWIDCNERVAVIFYYKTVPDTGNFPRLSKFLLDPEFPNECQQINSDPYGSIYDRGHMVPANHLDHDVKAITESNYMTNILPQHWRLNRGAWLHTEEIIECLRDDYDLEVFGGLIMGDDAKNDIFIKSHGVKTPDYYWKIIRNLKNEDIIAWIMPNDDTPIRSYVDKYLVSVDEIEKKSGFYFSNLNDKQRFKIQNVSWTIPAGCDKS